MTTLIRTTARAAALSTGILLSTALVASPAAAAPPSGGPDDRASCVGQVFVPQANGEPGQIADRIHEIMEVELPKWDTNFGGAISGGLARESWCHGD